MNQRICTKSQDNGRHNFNPHTGDCMWGCGVNQRGAPKPAVNAFQFVLARMTAPKPKTRIHTEKQDLIKQMIERFHEPKEIVVGGKKRAMFGYYCGRLKNVSVSLLYQWLSEIKQSPDIRNEGAVFWWKVKKWHKEHKKPQ